jgi:L-ascorbate metabolism protein UlaG (beta-lactamase superfamily)
MVTDAEVRLQYLSNSGFLLTTEEGRRVVIDPYLTGNAAAPFGAERIPPLDLIIVTHAAFDHLGDVGPLWFAITSFVN